MDAGFGDRLRMERERRRITLDSIAANTKIGLPLLQGLERGNVSRWPSGIFRRSFIRAYAEAIGLEPDEIAREFLERFPDPAEFPGAASSRSVREKTPPPAYGETVLRLKLAESGAPSAPAYVLAGLRTRCAAALCDACVLMAIGLMLFIAFAQFWMPFAVAVLLYYGASILLLGNTPGVSLFAHPSFYGRGDRLSAPPTSWLKTAGSAIRNVGARLSEAASR